MRDKKNKEHEEILVAYQALQEGIRYSKSQLWLANYYLLLIQGAIMGLIQVFSKHHIISFRSAEGMFLLAMLFAVLGTRRIFNLQKAMTEYRILANHLIKQFQSEVVRRLLLPVKTQFSDCFLITFLSSIWIGTLIVIIAINAKGKIDQSWWNWQVWIGIALIVLIIIDYWIIQCKLEKVRERFTASKSLKLNVKNPTEHPITFGVMKKNTFLFQVMKFQSK